MWNAPTSIVLHQFLLYTKPEFHSFLPLSLLLREKEETMDRKQ